MTLISRRRLADVPQIMRIVRRERRSGIRVRAGCLTPLIDTSTLPSFDEQHLLPWMMCTAWEKCRGAGS